MRKVVAGILLLLVVVSLISAQEMLTKEDLKIQKMVEKALTKGPEYIAEQFYKMREDENQKVCEAIVEALVVDYRENKEERSFKLVDFLNALHIEHGAVRPSTTTYACSLVVEKLDKDESAEIYELLDPLVQKLYRRQMEAKREE